MSIFEAPEYDGHEQVCFFSQPEVGLRAIIAVHSTELGPAIGGCRMWPYAREQEAIRDILRLSRGMTYKTAVLGLNLGGGKSVIFGDPNTQKTPELFQALGRAVNSLNGRYIAAEDLGTNPLDMREIRKSTEYVSCLRQEDGGHGDPAPLTALGTFRAIQAGVEHRFGTTELQGLRVAVQGIGNVGFNLCQLLHDAGAELVVSDVLPSNLQRAVDAFGAQAVDPDAIYAAEADIFAPCALGAILNDQTIPQLKAGIIAGGANNQLDDEVRHGLELKQRGIVYLPDYVACGGGVIGAAAEWFRSDASAVRDRVSGIYDKCKSIIELSEQQGITTGEAANQIAEKRLGRLSDLAT